MVKNDELAVFVALDRSGSMHGERWTTAIESLNDYIKGLQKEKIEGEVTVVAFDSIWGSSNLNPIRLETIVENKSIAYFDPLKHDILSPAGNTPLYDAAANVMERAIERNAKRTVVVILTDGEENASREYTQSKIKDKVKSLQEKNWEVIFLGANFDVTTYATQSGLASSKMRNVDFANKFATATMSADLWSNTVSYARTGAAMDMSNVNVNVNVKV